MKTAFVFLTRNAAGGEDGDDGWESALRAVEEQIPRPDLLLVADSESDDGTVETARRRGWEIFPVERRTFNHGGTRTRILNHLKERDFDVAVFATQDAVPATPDSVEKLTGFLRAHRVSAAYGRQLPKRRGSYDAWQRERCYPDSALVKSGKDIPRLGLMTPFCSNTFCAWEIDGALQHGGFPDADFGEDMLLAGTVILNGGSIGYCPDAACRHGHSDSPAALWKRGFRIGRMHRRNRWLAEAFGKPDSCGWNHLKTGMLRLPILAAAAIKYAGFLAGRFLPERLPVAVVIFFLMWMFLLPALLLSDLPKNDVATRYAPMAEAFAAGHWEFAFHPRIQPLFPMIAGVFTWLLRTDGFTACKLASALMLTLGVFPLYGAARRIYGARVAGVTVGLYAACSYLFRLGYSGLRETTGVFGLLMMFYAASLLWKNRRSNAAYACFSSGAAVLILSRGDMLPFAALACLALFFADWRLNRVPFRAASAGLLLLLLTLPWLAFQYRQVGYPVTDVRQAEVLRKLEQRLPLGFLRNPRPLMPPDAGAEESGGGTR